MAGRREGGAPAPSIGEPPLIDADIGFPRNHKENELGKPRNLDHVTN